VTPGNTSGTPGIDPGPPDLVAGGRRWAANGDRGRPADNHGRGRTMQPSPGEAMAAQIGADRGRARTDGAVAAQIKAQSCPTEARSGRGWA
jgi:hypothetical protein